MKFYTPALVSAKKKRSFWTLFVGQASAQKHYSARHRTEDMTIMWLEASQFGKINAFPCVLREGEEYMVFYTAKTPQTSKDNADFIKRWCLFVSPNNINTEWDVQEMEKKDFYTMFHEIQHNVLDAQIKARENAGKAAEPAQIDAGQDDYIAAPQYIIEDSSIETETETETETV